MERIIGFVLLLPLFFFGGCSTEGSTEQSIAHDELKNNPEVDLFILNHSVYKITNTYAVYMDEDELTLIGEIERVYEEGKELGENMATLLPVGTTLFQLEGEPIIYAKIEQGYLSYESISEG